MASLVTISTSQTSPTDSLKSRLHNVKTLIAEKTSALGFDSEPTLIVVTKNHPASLVDELIRLGVRDFGENRDQEAATKSGQITELTSDRPINWHFVGQLQSNKVKSVLQYSNWIHTLDRDSLLTELAKRTSGMPTGSVNVFIEINLTEREDRGGVKPTEIASLAARVESVTGLNLVGLMAVARPEVDPRVDFDRVGKLREGFLKDFPQANLLSLGMSGDFLEAIEYGATHLRIGTAITGHRPSQT